jgi:hypothetical protein
VCLAAGPAAAQSPFATRVLEYAPAPGQFVQNAQFNDPSRALGPPGTMGGLTAGDNTKAVTLGGFGGTITLGFDRSIWHNARNPRAMDFIVYGNGFYVSGDPLRRHGECGVIEVSRDDNHNGLADDAWYLIPGSHLGADAQRVSVQWDAAMLSPTYVPAGRSGVWTTSGYKLPGGADGFGASPVLVNPNSDGTEAVWGYADVGPTLLLGDTTATNVVDDPEADPARFYTVPDDPRAVGVTPGSGGGAAISLAWAVDETTGALATPPLDRVDFVRITTAIDAGGPPLGEISTEVSAVADVRAVYTPDWDGDGVVGVADIFAFLNSWFAGAGEAGGADFNESGATTVQDIFDFLNAWFAG